MKNLIVIITLMMVGCTSIKDTNGKDAGTCIGLPCLLHAAVGHPMVAQAPEPASVPVDSKTQSDQPAVKAEE